MFDTCIPYGERFDFNMFYMLILCYKTQSVLVQMWEQTQTGVVTDEISTFMAFSWFSIGFKPPNFQPNAFPNCS